VMSLIIAITGFAPALAAAVVVYDEIRQKTLLPVTMSLGHLGLVLGASLVMAAVSALLAVSGLRRADPADVF
jgi:putative ABC transport system permease protein